MNPVDGLVLGVFFLLYVVAFCLGHALTEIERRSR